MAEKKGYVVRVTDCDFAAISPSDVGIVVIGLSTNGSHDLHLELTPKALASLEAKLAAVMEAQRDQKRTQ